MMEETEKLWDNKNLLLFIQNSEDKLNDKENITVITNFEFKATNKES
jgi:hypothetical protein